MFLQYKLHCNISWEWDLAHSLNNASKLALKSSLLFATCVVGLSVKLVFFALLMVANICAWLALQRLDRGLRCLPLQGLHGISICVGWRPSRRHGVGQGRVLFCSQIVFLSGVTSACDLAQCTSLQ